MSNQDKLFKIAQALEPFIDAVKNVGGFPLTVVEEVNKNYRLPEREMGELALASGMSYQTLKDIVVGLVNNGAGDAIKVFQMVDSVFSTLGNTVDFQDPVNINAIFGGMQRVTVHKGAGLENWLKEELLPILQKTKEMGLNPKQITSFINDNVSMNVGADVNEKYTDPNTGEEVLYTNVIETQDGQRIDRRNGQQLKVETSLIDTGKNQQNLLNIGNAALAKGSQGWEEAIGWKGDNLRNTMDYTQKLRETTTPISMRPDDQQRSQALIDRSLSGLSQERLNLMLSLEQGLAPGTLLGIEDARKALGLSADVIEPAARKLNVVPQVATYLNETLTNPTKYILNPEQSLSSGTTPKTASSNKKLKRVAQINPQSTYTYNFDPNNPAESNEFYPQPQSGISAWNQDVGQSDITSSAAAQARELERASIFGEILSGQITQIEKRAETLDLHYKQFESGLANIDSLSRQGITDEIIIKEMVPMIQELSGLYNALLGTNEGEPAGLYVQALEIINAKIQTISQGDPNFIQGTLSKYYGFKSELELKMSEAVYRQKSLIADAATIEERMKAKIQESVVSDTLQKTTDLYGTMGSTVGRAELAASQSAEAQYLDQAANNAALLGSGISPVMQARLKQKALEKMQKSLHNLELSGQSTIPNQSDTINTLGL